MANVRIIEQPEITTLSGGEFLVTDSQAAGTKKITPANLVASAGGSGLTEDTKQALLQIASKVVYIDEHGQDYYDDLFNALYAVTAVSLNVYSATINTIGGTVQLSASTVPAGASVTWTSSNTAIATVSASGLVTSAAYGNCTITATAGSVSASCSLVVSQATLTSISAVYTQSGTVYDTDSLDSLKTDLVVTALWSDTTQTTVPSTDYTLSGTLAVGTSTVTVSYGGKTTTFNVTVTAAPTLSSISAVYTQSGTVYDTDSLDSLKADLVVTATYSDSSTATVPSTDYTLSGTLAEGTSTITVSYQSKTTTFNVIVSEASEDILKDGTHTFSSGAVGAKITVTNNHRARLETPLTSGQHYVRLNNVTLNSANSTSTSNWTNGVTTLHTLTSGQVLQLQLKNFECYDNNGNAVTSISTQDNTFTVAIKDTSNSTVLSIECDPRNGTVVLEDKESTLNVTSTKTIGAVVLYYANHTGYLSDLSFDCIVLIDGVPARCYEVQ